MWAVLGGEPSWGTLQAVMDQLEEANQSPQEFRTPPNFRVIVNVNQLVKMATNADTAEKKARELKASKAAAEAALAAPQTPATPESKPAPVVTDPDGNSDPRERRQAAFARRRERGGQIFRETMAEGDDRIEVDSRLTETGARVRVRLEEGFVKIFGRLLASRLLPDTAAEVKRD